LLVWDAKVSDSAFILTAKCEKLIVFLPMLTKVPNYLCANYEDEISAEAGNDLL